MATVGQHQAGMNEHELAPCNEDTALEAIRELTERAAGAEPRPEQLVNFVKNQRGLKLSYIHAKQAIEHYFGAGRDFIVNTPAPALHGASFDVPAIPAPVTFVPQRPFQAEATEPQIREGKWSKEGTDFPPLACLATSPGRSQAAPVPSQRQKRLCRAPFRSYRSLPKRFCPAPLLPQNTNSSSRATRCTAIATSRSG